MRAIAASTAATPYCSGSARYTTTSPTGWNWRNEGRILEAVELSHRTNSLPEAAWPRLPAR